MFWDTPSGFQCPSEKNDMKPLMIMLALTATVTMAASTPRDSLLKALQGKYALPIGTFQTTGKFKTLCSCMNGSGTGVVESSIAVAPGGVNDIESNCVVPVFQADGTIGQMASCSPWVPLAK